MSLKDIVLKVNKMGNEFESGGEFTLDLKGTSLDEILDEISPSKEELEKMFDEMLPKDFTEK
tara:strand:- start:45 stop:230 length:186 start_codon:yes stop_codon:yes gene_type:complete